MVKFNVQLIFHGRPKTLDAVECVLPIVNVHVYSFVLQWIPKHRLKNNAQNIIDKSYDKRDVAFENNEIFILEVNTYKQCTELKRCCPLYDAQI